MSSPSGVHLETGVLAETFDFDQPRSDSNPLELLALFGAAIPTGLPPCEDQGLDLVPRGAGAQQLPQISPFRRVEAQEPHAVGREPAPQVAQKGVVVDAMIPNVVPSGRANRCAGAEVFSRTGSIGP